MTPLESTSSDPGAASDDWIGDRLDGARAGIVTSCIPRGFGAYARLLHPASSHRDPTAPVRWADVANWSGVVLHREVQWLEVALPEESRDEEPPWDGGPHEGSLALVDTLALIEDLTVFTAPPATSTFAVWRGYGDLTYPPPARDGDSSTRPQRRGDFELPDRRYALFEGAIAEAAHLDLTGRRFQSPNLWWPSDRAWFVASDIDLPWTYVGGSKELISHLHADPRLEVVEARAPDRIMADLPRWITTSIDLAADEVVRSGSAEVALALGVVQARLQRHGRRLAVLVTRSVRRNGSASSSTTVRTRRAEELLGDVRLVLRGAIGALA